MNEASDNGWPGWQKATISVAAVLGILVVVGASLFGTAMSIGIPARATGGSLLTFLSRGLPLTVYGLSLAVATITAGRARWSWLFTAACLVMVIGPPVGLAVLSSLDA